MRCVARTLSHAPLFGPIKSPSNPHQIPRRAKHRPEDYGGWPTDGATRPCHRHRRCSPLAQRRRRILLFRTPLRQRSPQCDGASAELRGAKQACSHTLGSGTHTRWALAHTHTLCVLGQDAQRTRWALAPTHTLGSGTHTHAGLWRLHTRWALAATHTLGSGTHTYAGLWHPHTRWALAPTRTLGSGSYPHAGLWHLHTRWALAATHTLGSGSHTHAGLWHTHTHWALAPTHTLGSGTYAHAGLWHPHTRWALTATHTLGSGTHTHAGVWHLHTRWALAPTHTLGSGTYAHAGLWHLHTRWALAPTHLTPPSKLPPRPFGSALAGGHSAATRASPVPPPFSERDMGRCDPAHVGPWRQHVPAAN
eukprot:6531853-Prymnesium_polylepis.1